MLPSLTGEIQAPRTAVFSMLVRDFMRDRPHVLAVPNTTRCIDLIGALAANNAGCAVIIDAAGRPIGIITESDVTRRIAYRVPGDTPVDTVMTTPALTIPRREYLYHAIATMRRHDLHYLPVVDGRGILAGILHLEDTLTVAASALVRQIDRLSQEGTLDGLKEVKAAQVDIAEELFADNVPAVDIQQLITRVNNDLVRRIGEAALRDMANEGWGEPPVTAATIVMGSAGRGENFLCPDQDNGFILSDYPDSAHTRIDTFFIELAERMCRDLNAVGVPYCNGYCMAINPLWRKSLQQWIGQIGSWTRKSNFVAIRLADIFFDFQPVWGDVELGHRLRERVTERVRNNHYFLRQMFQDKIDKNVSLGFFGGLVTEKDNPDYRGQVNLKYTGLLPFVSAIRLMAMREGLSETSTLGRIHLLHDQKVLSKAENDGLVMAFNVLTDILLRQQIRDWRAGFRVTYFVDPTSLSKRDRALLIDALKAIDALRKRVHLEFTAQLF